MKRVYISFASLLLSCTLQAQTPNARTSPTPATARTQPAQYNAATKVNYVRVLEPARPLTDPLYVPLYGNPKDVKQTTQYADGLGRPLETVSRGMSPQIVGDTVGRDMVTAATYDAFGRETFKYLPYVDSLANGKFKTNPFVRQAAFSTKQYPGEQVYYGETVYENSPLNRVLKTMSPGNSWEGKGRGVSQDYVVNALADSVKIWEIANTATAYPVKKPTDYPAGALFKTVTTDEAGNKVVEYKDKKDGLVLLKKVQLAATPGTAHVGWLCTYYVYDNLNNLRFVIPPKAVAALPAASWSLADTTLRKELCFNYVYDQRNRLITKQVPGADVLEMVYDIRDRLVLSQDGNLRKTNQYLYTAYDDINRPTQTALYTAASGQTLAQLRTLYNNTATLNPTLTGTSAALSYTYYDTYTYTGKKNAAALTIDTIGPAYVDELPISTAAKGLVTGSKVKLLDGTEQWLITTTYYDAKGRVRQVLADNIAGGVDVVTNLYDFSNRIISTKLAHTNPRSSTTPQTEVQTLMAYDHAGRLLRISKKLNGLSKVNILVNTYDSLGQLTNKLFKRSNGTDLEALEYNYNIRGWLKGINKNYIASGTGHYFGQELSYDYGFTDSLFNGNIAGIKWRGASDPGRAYGYTYDRANRLLKADFTQNNSGWNQSAGINYNVLMGDGINADSAYDANGNILRMQQYGLVTTTSSKIDDLRYNYLNGGNKLLGVKDAMNNTASTLGDFKEITTGSTDDYRYDANGNMISDGNKNIRQVLYNYLNLPNQVAINGKGTIKYVYDAAGVKHRKIVTDSTVGAVKTTTTDYIAGMIYENDSLQLISHEEGRIRVNARVSPVQYTYDFFVKDHLGNVRMVLTEQTSQNLYLASMETESAAVENELFSNVDASRSAKPAGYPDDQSAGKYVAKLNGNTKDKKVGPSLVLKVMAGDTISIGARAFYKSVGPREAKKQALPADMAIALAQAFGGSGSQQAHAMDAQVTNGTPFNENFLNNQYRQMKERDPQNGTNTNRPKAYLSFALFDDQFNLVDENSGVKQVQEAPDQLQTLAQDKMVASKSGFLYVYTSNETAQDVFFDNLAVVVSPGAVLEETHYYPFGLTMAGISTKVPTRPDNKFLYNGKELQNKEFSNGGLEWYDYGARMYDGQVGRFFSKDRLAELQQPLTLYHYCSNNPINSIDINGDIYIATTYYEKEQNDDVLKRFYAIIENGLGGFYSVTADESGAINLTSTGKEGKMSKEQKAFYEIMKSVISTETVYEHVLVDKNPRLLTGSWGGIGPGSIDVYDLEQHPDKGPITAQGVLAHEIYENKERVDNLKKDPNYNASKEDYYTAHKNAIIKAENPVNGSIRDLVPHASTANRGANGYYSGRQDEVYTQNGVRYLVSRYYENGNVKQLTVTPLSK